MSLNKCQNCLLGKSAEFDLCKMCESVLLKNKCDKCNNTLRKIQYYDYNNEYQTIYACGACSKSFKNDEWISFNCCQSCKTSHGRTKTMIITRYLPLCKVCYKKDLKKLPANVVPKEYANIGSEKIDDPFDD